MIRLDYAVSDLNGTNTLLNDQPSIVDPVIEINSIVRLVGTKFRTGRVRKIDLYTITVDFFDWVMEYDVSDINLVFIPEEGVLTFIAHAELGKTVKTFWN